MSVSPSHWDFDLTVRYTRYHGRLRIHEKNETEKTALGYLQPNYKRSMNSAILFNSNVLAVHRKGKLITNIRAKKNFIFQISE